MSTDIETSIANLRKQLDEIASAVAGSSGPVDERLRAIMEAHHVATLDELDQRLSKLDWIEECREKAKQFADEEKPLVERTVQLRILRALADLDGRATKREIMRKCHVNFDVATSALSKFAEDGSVRKETEITGGRPREWYVLV